MTMDDTPRNRVASAVMEYALKYGMTYEEAEAIFHTFTSPTGRRAA